MRTLIVLWEKNDVQENLDRTSQILFIILDHCCVVLPTKKSPDHRLAYLKVGSVFSRGGSSARLKFAAIERLISWIN
jgi:hypothetical protein